ncbi:myo-inositol-1(or 4)-monophosphatase/histidinol-phosphatase [Lentzea fradiae]|uniref:Myo-inositol-1(Or 4)-monophosphatase/histidinol-phosphatase n=1 Tax=Lentzea fradiae TaxID=200378 RepID=A0A1G7KBA8_9PSEU|nr:inositol monophosphatase family protein [Lentzea fradiae]SDF34513.1 myo-inositol-1(or 4)-monophosphatase/histidinol-phosphatase [Lentzea fradiae]
MWTDMCLALRIAREAAEVADRAFAEGVAEVRHKADGSEVTAADLAVEDLVRQRLAELLPDDGVHGEERPERRGTSGRRWLVDPISGTADFVHGRPSYSVDLALEGALAVSVMPSLGITIAAGRGMGCRVFRGRHEEVARVSTQDSLDHARVCLHGKRKPVLGRGVVVDGSLSVLRLVTGGVDAVIAAGAGLDEFDLACLPVLVEEAGGRVTAAGDDVVLASNGPLHDALLGLVARPGVEPGTPGS